MAQENQDRRQALVLRQQELKAMRWHQSHPVQVMLEMLFNLSSHGGRSILRPMVGFVLLWLGMGGYYYLAGQCQDGVASLSDGIWLALQYSLPFLPAPSHGAELVLNGPLLLNRLLGLVLLFLLGLGLRNYFRL